jgi:hypothetical protein
MLLGEPSLAVASSLFELPGVSSPYRCGSTTGTLEVFEVIHPKIVNEIIAIRIAFSSFYFLSSFFNKRSHILSTSSISDTNPLYSSRINAFFDLSQCFLYKAFHARTLSGRRHRPHIRNRRRYRIGVKNVIGSRPALASPPPART